MNKFARFNTSRFVALKNRASALKGTAVAGLIWASATAAQAGETDTAVAAVKAEITSYGVLLLGVCIAIWGIRKGISMWGGR